MCDTGATGATEEDKNRTISKDRKRDSRELEEGEIVEDEGKNTEAAIASDEDQCAMDATKSTGAKTIWLILWRTRKIIIITTSLNQTRKEMKERKERIGSKRRKKS